MKNKRGSHVGIMISFMIFVSFLVFLITIINPDVKKQEDKDYLVDLLKTNLYGEISSDSKINVIALDTFIPFYSDDEEYENLKQKFGLPSNYEFWFNLKDEFKNNVSSESIIQREITNNLDIYVEEIPVFYLNEDDEIKNGILVLKIWKNE